MAAFQGMHVSPGKQLCMTTGLTDTGQSDPYVLLCFAGNTTSVEGEIVMKPFQILEVGVTSQHI